ncbi:MAG: SDR family NAD(P)-dependent oxidoreductase, partial [Stellaceae bacterium]
MKGRTALVTGASMGIGRAIALRLAGEGARLVIAARRKDLLEQVADDIEKAGGVRPAVVVADVMQPESPQRIRDEAARALGKIEILVNSAGGSRPLPADAPDQSWDEALTLNFTRLRQLTHAILPGMIAQKWGRIVNITGKSEPERINASFAA